VGLLPEDSHLLSELPGRVLADLFASTKPVKLAANKVLFHAGDPGDGCYRVDEGLLKVVMVSRTGSERILAFLGPGGIVGELSNHRWPTTFRIGSCRARCSTGLPQPHRVRGFCERTSSDL
jgi:CRP-like cAMP-binding protein